jgi:Tfp pilus assembly protein PilF
VGEADRAAGNYDKAYAFSPTAERAMGACQASLRANRDRPCELLDQWLAAHAGDIGARMFRAAASEQRGDVQAAIADYEAVLVYSPNNANALNNLAWLYHRTGDPRALGTAERALKAAPEAPAIMDTAGWVVLLAGDRNRGLKLLTDAAARAPANPDIRYHLAYAQAQNGQAATARQTLDELLAGNTEFASRQDAQSLRQSLAR